MATSPLRTGLTFDQAPTPEVIDQAFAPRSEAAKGLEQAIAQGEANAAAARRFAAERAGNTAEMERQAALQAQFEQTAAANAPRVSSLRDVQTKGDAFDWAAGVLPGALYSSAPSALAGVGGALLGRGLGSARLGAQLGAMTQSVADERAEALANQYNDPTLSQASVAERGRAADFKGLVGGAMEALVPGAIGHNAFAPLKRGLGNQIGKEAVEEGLTEAAQEGVGQYAEQMIDPTRQFDPIKIAEAGAAGAVGGAGMSAAGNTIGAAGRILTPAAYQAGQDAADWTQDKLAELRQPAESEYSVPSTTPQMPTLTGALYDRYGRPSVEAGIEAVRQVAPEMAEKLSRAIEAPVQAAGRGIEGAYAIRDRAAVGLSMGLQGKELRDFAMGVSLGDYAMTDLAGDAAIQPGATPEETEANISRYDQERAQRSQLYAQSLINDPNVDPEVKSRITQMNGNFTDADQRWLAGRVASRDNAQQFADWVRGNEAAEAQQKGKVFNQLDTMSVPEQASMLALLTQHVRPEAFGGDLSRVAPHFNQMSKMMLGLAAKTGKLTTKDVESMFRLTDVLQFFNDPERLVQEVSLMASQTGGQEGSLVDRVRAFSKARADLAAGPQSFLANMLPKAGEITPQQRMQIARAVDMHTVEMALHGRSKKAKAIEEGLTSIFGTPQATRTVLDYYAANNAELKPLLDEEVVYDANEGQGEAEQLDSDQVVEQGAADRSINEREVREDFHFHDPVRMQPFFNKRDLGKGKRDLIGRMDPGANIEERSYLEYLEQNGISPRSAKLNLEAGLKEQIEEHRRKLQEDKESPAQKFERHERVKDLEGKLKQLSVYRSDNEEELKKALGGLTVLSSGAGEARGDTVVPDELLQKFKENLSNKEGRTTAITFEMANGKPLRLSAESMIRHWARETGRHEGLSEEGQRKMLADAVAGVLARDDIKGIKTDLSKVKMNRPKKGADGEMMAAQSFLPTAKLSPEERKALGNWDVNTNQFVKKAAGTAEAALAKADRIAALPLDTKEFRDSDELRDEREQFEADMERMLRDIRVEGSKAKKEMGGIKGKVAHAEISRLAANVQDAFYKALQDFEKAQLNGSGLDLIGGDLGMTDNAAEAAKEEARRQKMPRVYDEETGEQLPAYAPGKNVKAARAPSVVGDSNLKATMAKPVPGKNPMADDKYATAEQRKAAKEAYDAAMKAYKEDGALVAEMLAKKAATSTSPDRIDILTRQKEERERMVKDKDILDIAKHQEAGHFVHADAAEVAQEMLTDLIRLNTAAIEANGDYKASRAAFDAAIEAGAPLRVARAAAQAKALDDMEAFMEAQVSGERYKSKEERERLTQLPKFHNPKITIVSQISKEDLLQVAPLLTKAQIDRGFKIDTGVWPKEATSAYRAAVEAEPSQKGRIFAAVKMLLTGESSTDLIAGGVAGRRSFPRALSEKLVASEKDMTAFGRLEAFVAQRLQEIEFDTEDAADFFFSWWNSPETMSRTIEETVKGLGARLHMQSASEQEVIANILGATFDESKRTAPAKTASAKPSHVPSTEYSEDASATVDRIRELVKTLSPEQKKAAMATGYAPWPAAVKQAYGQILSKLKPEQKQKWGPHIQAAIRHLLHEQLQAAQTPAAKAKVFRELADDIRAMTDEQLEQLLETNPESAQAVLDEARRRREEIEAGAKQVEAKPVEADPKARRKAEKEIKALVAKLRGTSVIAKAVDPEGGVKGTMRFADVLNRTIEVNVGADGSYDTSTVHHEAMHDFFEMLRQGEHRYRPEVAKVRRALQAWAHDDQVMRTLAKHYQGTPAWAHISRTDEVGMHERIAYGYQLWVEGKLNLEPKADLGVVGNFFRDLFRWFASLIGVHFGPERAQEVFAAFAEGRFADETANGGLKMAEWVRANPQFVPTAAEKAGKAMGEMAEKLVSSASTRMRATGLPAAIKLADLFHQDVGREGQGLGFLQERAMQTGVWTAKLNDILKDTNAQQRAVALRNLQSMRHPKSTLEHNIRALLEEMHAYLQEAGVKRQIGTDEYGKPVWGDMGKVTNYFPRYWDSAAIRANPEKFAEALEPFMGEIAARTAADKIALSDGMTDLADNDQQIGFTPGAESVNRRVFDFINVGNAHEFVEFQIQDLTAVLTSYVNKAVHRAEYARRFGNGGEKLTEILQDLFREGATQEDLETIMKGTAAMTGVLGANEINRTWAGIQGNIIAIENLALLPLSLFASLIDPLGIAIRTGSFKDAWEGFKRGMEQLRKDLTSKVTGAKQEETELELLVRDLGVLDENSMMNAYGDAYSGNYMSRGLKKLNETFFRWNGMEGWNKAMRVQATIAGSQFILKHLRTVNDEKADAKAKAESKRYLDEMGLKAEDLKKVETKAVSLTRRQLHAGDPAVEVIWATNNREELLKSKEDDTTYRLRRALFKFVDSAVLRPNAAHRPIWGSDPRFALIFHLKQFTHSFQEVIMKRVWHEWKQGNTKPAQVALTYIPFMAAADAAKAMLLGKGFDMSLGQFFGKEVERSGLLGTGQYAVDAVQDMARGDNPAASFVGPAADHAGTIADWMAGSASTRDLVDRSVPLAKYAPK
jgi:hypothetical protein|nr:MAG TPA: hypothetical protein [Caudoviricetes sp.]